VITLGAEGQRRSALQPVFVARARMPSSTRAWSSPPAGVPHRQGGDRILRRQDGARDPPTDQVVRDSWKIAEHLEDATAMRRPSSAATSLRRVAAFKRLGRPRVVPAMLSVIAATSTSGSIR